MYGDIVSITMSKSTIRVNQSPLQSGLQCGSSFSSRTQSGPQTQGSPVSHCHFCRLCLRLSSTVRQDGSDTRFLVSRGSDLRCSNLNIRKHSHGHCKDFTIIEVSMFIGVNPRWDGVNYRQTKCVFRFQKSLLLMADLQERFQTNDMFKVNLIIPIKVLKYISN